MTISPFGAVFRVCGKNNFCKRGAYAYAVRVPAGPMRTYMRAHMRNALCIYVRMRRTTQSLHVPAV